MLFLILLGVDILYGIADAIAYIIDAVSRIKKQKTEIFESTVCRRQEKQIWNAEINSLSLEVLWLHIFCFQIKAVM